MNWHGIEITAGICSVCQTEAALVPGKTTCHRCTGSRAHVAAYAETENQSTEELVEKCIEVMRMDGKASVSLFQRRLHLGYIRARYIASILQDRGIISRGEGAVPLVILSLPPERSTSPVEASEAKSATPGHREAQDGREPTAPHASGTNCDQLRDPSGATVANALAPISGHDRVIEAMRNTEPEFLDGQEDKLQAAVRDYLGLHGIEYINPSMRRKSALPRGWPDFTFAYAGEPIACECKAGRNNLEPDQREMREKLIANGWRYLLCRSVSDIQALMRTIDADYAR